MISIRPLTYPDRDQLLRLIQGRQTFNAAEIRVAMELIDDTLSGRDPDYRIYCAQIADAELAGYICFGPIPMTVGCHDLYWIVVDQRYGRQGVGKRLLAYMEEELRAEGARQIHVDTSSAPNYAAARAFYAQNGFETACILADFYSVGDDKVILVKRLA